MIFVIFEVFGWICRLGLLSLFLFLLELFGEHVDDFLAVVVAAVHADRVRASWFLAM